MRTAASRAVLALLVAVLLTGSLLGDPSRDEEQLLSLVNEARRARGLGTLTWHRTLARLARKHATDMRKMGQATHASSRDGATFTTRLARSGMRAMSAAENVAFAPDIRTAHKGLMDSPGHRANILAERLTHIGIGISRDPSGGIYVAQNFATPIVEMSDAQATDAVRAAVMEAGSSLLRENRGISGRFERDVGELAASDSVDVSSIVLEGSAWIMAYTQTDPGQLPEEARRRMTDARTYAVAVTYRRTSTYPFGVYWVLLALMEY